MSGNADAGFSNLASSTTDDREYLYSVLNLPKTASEQEIRERYRQLSIVFHPDKQVDERRKDAATQRFLEVQKAYEVLSDPTSRRVYDSLGSEGLNFIQSVDFKHIAEADFEEELRRKQRELYRLRVEQAVHPRGNLNIGLDASSFFDVQYVDEDGSPLPTWQSLLLAFSDVKKQRLALRHRIQTELNKKTWLTLASRVVYGANPGRRGGIYANSTLMGTVKHQFSPRLNFQATTSLLSISGLSVKGVYQADDYVVACQSQVHPLLFLQPFRARPSLLLPLTVSVYRRLFPKSPLQGILEASITPSGPTISVGVSSTAFHDTVLDQTADDEPHGMAFGVRAPSSSGLAFYTSAWQIGFDLAGVASGLSGRYGVTLLELGVELQAVIRLGLAGFTWLLGADWRGNNAAVGANVSVNPDGVVLRVEATYYQQTLSLPIILSHECNESLAFWTAVFPSTALAILYYFKLRPGRRRQRIEYLEEARRQLREEKSDLLRQWQETIYLLQDTASRHMRTEEACDGLIILDARYGLSENGQGTEGLDVNVTIPVQALVNSSQLFIPGKRSKAGIPGFYDPVAGEPKTLRMRYKFRGRMHYAEIPDYMPVVLPLKDHLVE